MQIVKWEKERRDTSINKDCANALKSTKVTLNLKHRTNRKQRKHVKTKKTLYQFYKWKMQT